MAKTVKIDKEDVIIDENYYVLYKMLELILAQMKTGTKNGR